MFTGIVDLEAITASVDVTGGIGGSGSTLSQRVWTFGVHPQAGLEAYFWPNPDSDVRIVVRAVGGYAWRLDTAFDALSGGGDARTVNLGSVDFSGATATVTVGVRF